MIKYLSREECDYAREANCGQKMKQILSGNPTWGVCAFSNNDYSAF